MTILPERPSDVKESGGGHGGESRTEPAAVLPARYCDAETCTCTTHHPLATALDGAGLGLPAPARSDTGCDAETERWHMSRPSPPQAKPTDGPQRGGGRAFTHPPRDADPNWHPFDTDDAGNVVRGIVTAGRTGCVGTRSFNRRRQLLILQVTIGRIANPKREALLGFILGRQARPELVRIVCDLEENTAGLLAVTACESIEAIEGATGALVRNLVRVLDDDQVLEMFQDCLIDDIDKEKEE